MSSAPVSAWPQPPISEAIGACGRAVPQVFRMAVGREAFQAIIEVRRVDRHGCADAQLFVATHRADTGGGIYELNWRGVPTICQRCGLSLIDRQGHRRRLTQRDRTAHLVRREPACSGGHCHRVGEVRLRPEVVERVGRARGSKRSSARAFGVQIDALHDQATDDRRASLYLNSKCNSESKSALDRSIAC